VSARGTLATVAPASINVNFFQLREEGVISVTSVSSSVSST
jgi:hypothetical protein